ncbi:MAG: hypothetical protein J0H73_05305 [Salana multivorans]|uniref:hypothetical protein n=1 Tax=Salana multivorans TaxID=120377 RepID=UPI00095C7B2C|nr:hypothetical protein [Salana multivorans]MBN8881715.1 hypothetical protein [Salana multivorans]OJX98671.1 MAG: hypothetical protein BGO96_04645 [Micrococcales bacterium 73-15]
MVNLPAVLTPHTVTVKPFEGESAYGPVHGAERELRRVRVEGGNRLVRDKTGAEVVSSARLFTRPEHGGLVPGSLVLLHAGTALERWAEVISVRHEHTPPAPEHYDHALT